MDEQRYEPSFGGVPQGLNHGNTSVSSLPVEQSREYLGL
jgi:hypothetical protein